MNIQNKSAPLNIFSLLDDYTRLGNLDKFKECYEEYPDLVKNHHCSEKEGYNYLHHACKYGQPNILEYLIDIVGFDCNHRRNFGSTVLHDCMKHNNFKGLKLFIEKYKMNINSVDNGNLTALMTGIITSGKNFENIQSCEYLIKQGIDLNISDKYYKYTALYFAGIRDDFYTGKLLVESNRIDYYHKDRNGLDIEKFLETNLKKDPSLLLYVMMHKQQEQKEPK